MPTKDNVVSPILTGYYATLGWMQTKLIWRNNLKKEREKEERKNEHESTFVNQKREIETRERNDVCKKFI